MKKTFLSLLFFLGIVSAQGQKFVWVTNLAALGENKISQDSLVRAINSIEKLNFVVFTDNLTKGQSEDEYAAIKEKLDELNVPYFLLPSPLDLKDKGALNYKRFWYDINFKKKLSGFEVIGLAGESILNLNTGHFTPETIKWLRKNTEPNKKYLLITQQGLFTQFDNWQEILFPLNEISQTPVLSYNTDKPKSINSPLITIRTDKKEGSGFNLLVNEVIDDTIFSQIWLPGKEFKLFQTTLINTKPDSTDVTEEKEDFGGFELIFDKRFNSTLGAEPIYNSGKIIICEREGIIYCIDTTGNLIWDFDAFGNIISKPVIADGKLIAATQQGDILVLELETGLSIQTIGFEEGISSDLLAIEYMGDKQLLIPKFTDSKTAIVFGTATGKIYCYDLETFQEYWSNKDANDMIYGTLLFERDKVLAQSINGNLYCIDAKKGWLVWKWNERTKTDPNIYKYATIIYDKKVFVAGSSGYVYSIDLFLGKTDWQSEKFRPCTAISLTPDMKKLVAKVYNEKLILLSQSTGTNLNVIKYADGYDSGLGAIFNDGVNIFTTSSEGKIFKITNFKKSEEILSLTKELLFCVSRVEEDKYLISTIDGRIILAKLK